MKMHSAERLGLRAWLEQVLDSAKYAGVRWIDQPAGMFSISWTHASRRGWTEEEDAAVFRDWAIHTGRYKEGTSKPEPKIWKANFRCAVNASRDIEQIRGTNVLNSTACRVFVFTKTRRSKVTVPQRNSCQPKGEKKTKYTANHAVRRPNIRSLNTSLRKTERSNDVYAEKCKNLRITLKSTQIPRKTKTITVAHFKKITSEGSVAVKKSAGTCDLKEQHRITKPNDGDGQFSFSELLQKIPEDACKEESIIPSPSPSLSWGTADEEDLFKYIKSDNASCTNSDLDSSDGYLSPPHQVYSPNLETSDSEDMAEVFDHHHEWSFAELENILRPNSVEKKFEEIDSNRHINMFDQLNNMEGIPLSSINAYSFSTALLTSDISDPFLSPYDFNEANILKAMVIDS